MTKTMGDRPDKLHGSTHRLKTGCGNLYVTINLDESGKPEEVFVRLGKAGGCASSQTEALGRLITLALRHDVPIEDIIKHLGGIGCHQPAFSGGGGRNLSCADAVANALKAHVSQKEESLPCKQDVGGSSPPVGFKKTADGEEQKAKVNFEKVFKEVDKIVEEAKEKKGKTFASGACPDCGANLVMEEGCAKCYQCGFTKC